MRQVACDRRERMKGGTHYFFRDSTMDRRIRFVPRRILEKHVPDRIYNIYTRVHARPLARRAYLMLPVIPRFQFNFESAFDPRPTASRNSKYGDRNNCRAKLALKRSTPPVPPFPQAVSYPSLPSMFAPSSLVHTFNLSSNGAGRTYALLR